MASTSATTNFATATNRPEDWSTVLEAAAWLRISPASVYRAIRNGDLKAKAVNGRGDLRIARSWLLEWTERGHLVGR